MSSTSIYGLKVKTDSADTKALLLLAQGELVAILVELEDECHGDDRGRWAIESTFGLRENRQDKTFASAADAADWVSDQMKYSPFLIDEGIVGLR